MNDEKTGKLLRFWIVFAVITFILATTDMLGIARLRTNRKVTLIADGIARMDHEQLIRGILDESSVQGFDLRIRFLSKNYDVQEQKNIIAQEIDNGAEGLIIIPTSEKEIKDWILEQKYITPIVYMYSEHIPRWWSISAGYDAKKAGEELAERIEGENREARIVVSEKYPGNTYMANIETALKNRFGRNDVDIKIYSDQAELADKLRGYAETGGKTILIGDRVEAVSTMVQLSGIYKGWDSTVYSIGCDNIVMNEIENEKVAGAIGWSDYLVGVKVIQSMSNMFRAFSFDFDIKVDHYYINALNIKQRNI